MNKENLKTFYSVADVAATQWYCNKYYYKSEMTWVTAAHKRLTDSKAMTFRSPNFKHATGYIAFLSYIADCEKGATRREICDAFNVKSVNLSMDTLCYAGLVKLDSKYTHKFTITPFGRVYLKFAKLVQSELETIAQAKELMKCM